jgi:hypothetical protein
LLVTYSNYDLLEKAASAAYAEASSERPRLEVELANTEAQLKETSTAIDRYLRAFEAGTMSDTLGAPRIAELSERRDELTARRDELTIQVRASTTRLPRAAEIRAVSGQLEMAIRESSPDVVKQLLDELIDRVGISPDKASTAILLGSRRTPARGIAGPGRWDTGSYVPNVEAKGIEPTTSSMPWKRSTN